MKVRWLVYHQGHGGPHYPGDLADLPDEVGRRLIEHGNAEAPEAGPQNCLTPETFSGQPTRAE